jgi:hypothetical protein
MDDSSVVQSCHHFRQLTGYVEESGDRERSSTQMFRTFAVASVLHHERKPTVRINQPLHSDNTAISRSRRISNS